MKSILFASALTASLVGTSAFAAAAKTYQVTGPILAVTDTTVTVQKGSEKWELTRDASTKTTGDLKVGQKVTIQYRMVATEIESKETPAKK